MEEGKQMPMILKDWIAKKVAIAAKKAKRKDNARFIAKIGGKKKVPAKTNLKAQLWTILSLYIRRRDSRVHNGLCLICKAKPIQCAYHIIPSNNGMATKYDEDNLVGACHSCNWAEKNWRLKYRQKHIDLFGRDRYEALEAKSKVIVKFSTVDLRGMLESFRRRLEAR